MTSYKTCTSPDNTDKVECRFYIWGGYEGATLTGNSVLEKSGKMQESKDKRYCPPEDLTSSVMELLVKMKIGADLAMYPEDRKMDAVSVVLTIMTTEFSCKKK